MYGVTSNMEQLHLTQGQQHLFAAMQHLSQPVGLHTSFRIKYHCKGLSAEPALETQYFMFGTENKTGKCFAENHIHKNSEVSMSIKCKVSMSIQKKNDREGEERERTFPLDIKCLKEAWGRTPEPKIALYSLGFCGLSTKVNFAGLEFITGTPGVNIEKKMTTENLFS